MLSHFFLEEMIMPVYSDAEYLRIIRPLPKYVKRDMLDIPVIEPVSIDISKMNNGLWLAGPIICL